MTFLLLFGAAVGRMTRLIVDDTILDRPRCWLVPKLPGYIQELLTCPWCLSGWLSGLTTLWLWKTGGLAQPFFDWFAIWWFACATYWLTEFLAAKTADSGTLRIEEENPDIEGFWKEHDK